MVGRISKEIEVKVPATEAWKVYGNLQLAKIVGEGLPDFFSKVEIVEGDGSAGTILYVFVPPGAGTAGLPWYKEKCTAVDDERRVKDADPSCTANSFHVISFISFNLE
ncbi:UNVERIFIED_CONTAM: hypothetical protein Sradi_1973100 [Sesamum radiatum]|uniref:Bet v I/Major latex protein domain-containing protein n=1 Tax=Sesamum radiatum TaxID=300843 RepID=A0AAW2TGL0_SESRA